LNNLGRAVWHVDAGESATMLREVDLVVDDAPQLWWEVEEPERFFEPRCGA
jgi:hypothetical protein